MALAFAFFPGLALSEVLSLQPTQKFQTFHAWRGLVTGPYFPKSSVSPPVSQHLAPTLLNQVLDDLTKDLGFTGFRIEIHSDRGIEQVNDNSDPFTINWAGFDFTKPYSVGGASYFDPVATMQEVVLPVKQRVEAQGLTFSSYISLVYTATQGEVPPHWRIPNEYAELVEAYLTHLQTRYNFQPTFWALYNEPDLNGFSVSELSSLIAATGPRIQQKGFSTKIQYPETERPDTAVSWVDAIAGNAAVTPYLGMISYHSYDYNSQAAPSSFSSRNTLRSRANQLGIFTGSTEICCKYSFSWNGNYKHGLELARDIYFNLSEADAAVWEPLALIGSCETKGCSAEPYGVGAPILLENDLSKSIKLAHYYCLRQFSHFIRPGYRRIGLTCSGCVSTSAGQSVKGLAFQSPSGEYVAVVINDQTSSRTVELASFPAGVYTITGVDPQNTVTHSYPSQTISAGQRISFVLPAQAIVTVVQGSSSAPDSVAPAPPTSLRLQP
ncbi:MAG: glycoside hydrolase family 30 beta sandwich domain-containing protein [Candidatus Entotheonellia bacterium]